MTSKPSTPRLLLLRTRARNSARRPTRTKRARRRPMCSWENIYSSITYRGSGKDVKAGLNGDASFIWAAGVMAVIACAMTAIDAAVLARTMRTGAARARPGEQSPTMTDCHSSSCKTEPSRCVTYPSAQQNNGAPAAGASELRVNIDPVSGPTSCSPTPTPGQQAGHADGSQPTENPFMKKSTV